MFLSSHILSSTAQSQEQSRLLWVDCAALEVSEAFVESAAFVDSVLFEALVDLAASVLSAALVDLVDSAALVDFAASVLLEALVDFVVSVS